MISSQVLKKNIFQLFVCFKDYDESIPNKLIAFKKKKSRRIHFGEFLANNGKKQLRLAETEEYAAL